MIRDLPWILLVFLVVMIFTRWVTQALTTYPGIPAIDALSIEAGEDLRRWGLLISEHGRQRLREDAADNG